MKWRFIPLEIEDAFMAMGKNEAVMKTKTPTIYFWRWKPSAVSIGRFQSMEEEVNVEHCKELGIDYVRRITGGGAVYHDYDGEITYSVIAPEEMLPRGITESYQEICGWIVKGLGTLGIEAEFKPINDIIAYGKKISGNAQTRRSGMLLQHGTILQRVDIPKMFSLLKVGGDKVSDKMIAAVEERVTSLEKEAGVSYQQAYEAIRDAFLANKEWEEGSWIKQELELAKELAETKYSTQEWNFTR